MYVDVLKIYVMFPAGHFTGAPWEGVWGQSEYVGFTDDSPQNAWQQSKIDLKMWMNGLFVIVALCNNVFSPPQHSL